MILPSAKNTTDGVVAGRWWRYISSEPSANLLAKYVVKTKTHNMHMSNGNKREREKFALKTRANTLAKRGEKCMQKTTHHKMEVDSEICSEVRSLPDGWDLLLHHHVCQEVVMLGQEESVDDRLSDLKGERKQNSTVTSERI